MEGPESIRSEAMKAPALVLAVLAALVLGLLPAAGNPLGISHWDLEGANQTCDGRSSCEALRGLRGRAGASRVGGDELDWRERNCFCDSLCKQYGDCCVDSPHFAAAEQRRSSALFSCVDLRQFGGIYMKGSCPPSWDDADVRHQCEVAEGPSDPISEMPVTSHASGYTYRNAFCALCHGDMNETNVEVWKPRLECPTLMLQRNIPKDEVVSALRWDPGLHSWGLLLPVGPAAQAAHAAHAPQAAQAAQAPHGDMKATSRLNNKTHHFYQCDVDPVVPETVEHRVRRCQADSVRTCAVNWTNGEVRSRCEAYTAYVYLDKTPYRNAHCAICNNVGLHYLQCQKAPTRSYHTKDFSPVAFAVLFDLLNVDGMVGKVKACPSSQLFDPFSQRCRSVLCPLTGNIGTKFRCVDGSPEAPANTNDVSSTNQYEVPITNLTDAAIIQGEPVGPKGRVHNLDTCPKWQLDSNEFTISDDNRTAIVPAYKRVFHADEFLITPDGRMEICALGFEWVDKFGPYMGYVTVAGLGVSVVFLILHLTAFALVPELRNLSGKNLASLCVSLLVAYIAFVAGQFIGKGTSCRIMAIIMYYSFLASFSWMLTMSLDVWRTLRLATCELRVSAGKQWRKFALYSLWTWLMPAAIVAAALVADSAAPGTIDDGFRPGFGRYSCWFAERDALLVFFAAPLAAIMLMNVIFFASSALMIVRTAPALRYAPPPPGGTSGTRRDFRLYIRLAIVMGLTWAVGLVAGCLDIEALWYAFIALNTLQGLFIFLAFTCTEKVVRGLGEVLPCWSRGWVASLGRSDGKPIRPPSFSWSGGSADSTHKSALGSSSESSSHHGLPNTATVVNGHGGGGAGVNGHHGGVNGHGVNGHGVNGHGVNGHGVNGHGVNGHNSMRHQHTQLGVHGRNTSDTLY